jgi:hypothetical protein
MSHSDERPTPYLRVADAEGASADDVGPAEGPRPGTEAAQLTRTVTDQASEVVDEARRQARDLLGEARDQLREQADAGQRKAADSLHALADELGIMVRRSKQTGLATDLVRQVGERTEDAARWLEDRGPGDLVEDVRELARRRPGVFLLGAAAAGVVVGRLTRSLTSDRRSTPTEPDGAGRTDVPERDPLSPPEPPPVSDPSSARQHGATAPQQTVGEYVEELERSQGVPLGETYAPRTPGSE